MFRDKKFFITYIIIAVNALMSILVFLVDQSFGVNTLIMFGAKYNPMIASGQYFRLLTSMFLHADFLHLLLNMYALNILGKNIEIVYGRVKFIVIYLIAGIFGSLGSFIFSQSVAVGASGAIFGLLGAYLYLYLSQPEIFNVGFLKNLLTIIGINLLFGIMVPNIDNWAHISGLIGGFLISWSLGIRGEKINSPKKILAQVLTVVLLFTCLFTGIKHNQDSWQYNLFKGIDYLKEEKFDNAEIEFSTGLTKNKNIEEFHYYLGLISLMEGDTKQAVFHLEKALEINPGFSQAKAVLKEITN